MTGFPGTDNPNGDTGSYSVDNIWHDSTEFEWCEPSHDWFKEDWLRWSSAATTKLTNERATHTIQVEQQVYPQTSYNYASGHDSNLPYNRIYVADIISQNQQGFEEVSFMVDDPGLITAGVNYHAYLQWEQEAKSGFPNTSPLLDHVITTIEYGNKAYFVQNYDWIGLWYKKLADNS
jgi:hypothetical protein